MFIEKKSQFQGMFPDLAVSMIRVKIATKPETTAPYKGER